MSDLQDLVTTERFREIHEARQQVIQDERTLNEALATGRIDDGRARRLFQRSVDTFVRELEWLLNATEQDGDSSEYWHEKSIGQIQLPNGRIYNVVGLGEYLDLDEELVVEVAVNEQDRYYELPKKEPDSRAVQPPWELLRSAFRVANAALTDLGMELDTGEEQDAEYDYSDLLDDEVDPETNDHASGAKSDVHG